MHYDTFQCPSSASASCAYIFKQTRNNNITKECSIICSPFGQIKQTVDSFDRPNNRN
jgi:hypothetical protein